MLINFVDATNDANHYTKPPLSQYISSSGNRTYCYAEFAVVECRLHTVLQYISV